MKLETAQQVADVATKVQYGGAGFASLMSFLNQNAAALGLLVAILGFAVNWYYKEKAHRLLERGIKSE